MNPGFFLLELGWLGRVEGRGDVQREKYLRMWGMICLYPSCPSTHHLCLLQDVSPILPTAKPHGSRREPADQERGVEQGQPNLQVEWVWFG